MRIPTTFARTSPPSSAHRKPTPPSLDSNLERVSHQSIQARVKPPTSFPKAHKQSMSLTTIPSQTLKDRHDLSAESQIASLNEARKKRSDPASSSYKTGGPILNQRTHIHKLQQNNLSPISENSNEDSVHLKEHERTQSKLVEENAEKPRKSDGSVKHYLPPGEGNPPLRRHAPEVESMGRDTSLEHTRGVQIYEDPLSDNASANMEEIPSLGKSLPRNEGQGEPCVGTTEISMGTKHEKGEIVHGNKTKIGSDVDEELLSSLSQDLPTQVSSREANQTSMSRSTTHMVTASGKYPSNFGPGNSKTGDLGESDRYMAQMSMKDKILLETKNHRKSRLMQTKTGSHNGLEAKANDLASTREGFPDKMATDAPRYDSENSRSRYHGRDTKPHAAQDSDVSDDCLDTNCDSKGYVEQKSSKLHSATLLEDGTMAPPPLGYHVRKDASNQESTNPGQSKKSKRACPNDVNVFRKHKDRDAHLLPNLASSGESVSYNGKGDMWKILYPKHKDKESPNHRSDYTNDGSGLRKHSRRHEYSNDGSCTAKEKHSRKLLIIGKLNCFLDTHKRKGKHGTKTQLVLKRGNRHAICDGSRLVTGDGSQESLRVSRTYSRALKASGEQALLSGETIKLLDEPKSTKVPDSSLHLRSLDGIKGYSRGPSHKGKHAPGVYIKKSARQQSVFKLSNGVCLKRLDVKRHSQEDQSPRKRSQQIAASQSILKLALENRKHSLKQSDRQRHVDVYRKSELMASRHMNANSNAGVFESCAENTADGKPDIRQSMGSSLSPNSKQCYSIRTDTEGNVFLASDTEARQPRFLPQEVDHSANTQQPAESLLTASTGNDQLKSLPQAKEYIAQLDAQGRTLATSERRGNKNVLQTNSEKAVNLKPEKPTSRSQTALKATTSDYAAMAASNYKRKNKSKIPEASMSKLENTTSKKTTSSTSVKMGMRIIASRHKLEPQKQPPVAGDVQKAVINAMEKSSKNYVDNVRLTRFIKNNEGQQEGTDNKVKQRPSYEANIGRAPWKELYVQDRPAQKAQGVRSTESDHRHSPIKTQDNSSKGQGAITKLASFPKTIPHQYCYKKTCLPLSNHVFTSGVNDIKHISEVKCLAAMKSRRLSTSPTIAVEPGDLSFKKDITNKTDFREMEEILRNHCVLSPQYEFSSPLESEFNISPNDKFNSSPKMKSIPSQEVKAKRELAEDAQLESSDKTVVTISQERVPSDLTLPENSESMNMDTSVVSRSARAKKCSSSLSEGSVPTNALGYANMHMSRKMESQKCEVDEDVQETRPAHSLVPTRKKKSQQRYKPQSKSPDGKKKKKIIKKSSTDGESSKPEKIKKLKTLEKLPEKKKKKKKIKQKMSESTCDSCESIQIDKCKSSKLKNVSSEDGLAGTNNMLNLRTEMTDSSQSQPELCPGVKLIGDNTQTPQLALAPNTSSLKDEVSLSVPVAHQHRSHERTAHSLDRLNVRASNETNYVTASAENISTPSDPVLEQPSQANPLVVTDPPSVVVVQVSTCPRAKKVERNLQEAELGWNSSTFSSDEKAMLEKGRLTQKRAKLRYYIVKTKPRKSDAEVTSKLKRPSTRLSLADDDVIKCGSESNINSEIVPQEKSRTSQGKSVQFSDNIQDLEELKPDLGADLLPLQRPDSDNAVHHTSTKPIAEILKTSSKLVVEAETVSAVKLSAMKKGDLRSPISSPKRRRPVWSKKPGKHTHAGTDKTESTGKPVSQHHSSESVPKPSSRFNIHVYYPVKQASPKLVNMSPGDKRKVSYNTWISNMCTAAPLDKTFKKLVAKHGSPVDIREIIEGSSVDGTDHIKEKKSTQDSNVRATKSASHVGLNRGLNSRKRDRPTEDVGSTPHKRSKDLKLREIWSPQARSDNEAKEDPVSTAKVGPVGSDGTKSQDWSTDIDSVSLPKRKVRYRKFNDHGHCVTKGHKLSKKSAQRSATKWQIVAAEETVKNTADPKQVRYSGDMMELNVINMGLSWVVQKVVNKLRFLKPKATLSDPSVVLSSTARDTTTEIASNN